MPLHTSMSFSHQNQSTSTPLFLLLYLYLYLYLYLCLYLPSSSGNRFDCGSRIRNTNDCHDHDCEANLFVPVPIDNAAPGVIDKPIFSTSKDVEDAEEEDYESDDLEVCVRLRVRVRVQMSSCVHAHMLVCASIGHWC